MRIDQQVDDGQIVGHTWILSFLLALSIAQ